jgi:hypothetical protein
VLHQVLEQALAFALAHLLELVDGLDRQLADDRAVTLDLSPLQSRRYGHYATNGPQLFLPTSARLQAAVLV